MMVEQLMEKLQNELVVVGVNYRKTSLEIRNKFAFTTEMLKRVYAAQKTPKHERFFILSTCNRTEIYGVNVSPDFLLNIFKTHTNVSSDDLTKFSFVKTNDEAVHHLFRVACGLDSQILGDYEIIGQLKNSFALAKTSGFVGGYLEKMVNSALQASRKVRKNTSISDGTTSVSYAVIQSVKQFFEEGLVANICLLGMGKFGEITLKNFLHYLPQHQLTVLNRNEVRALEISSTYKVEHKLLSQADEVISRADVLVVATGADHYIVTKSQIENSSVKMVFDLSVPSNVSTDVKRFPGVLFFDIDNLSEIVNQTLSKRAQQIPEALEIIDEHIGEFKEWEIRRALFAQALN